MTKFLNLYERWVTLAVVVMMTVAIAAATVELAVVLVKELLRPPTLLLDITEMLEVFGFFLMILIGLELLATVRAYLRHARLCVEVVFLVAMIALARKVIVIDYKETPPLVLLGIAALILSFVVGYTLLRRVHRSARVDEPCSGPGEMAQEAEKSCM